MFGMNPSVHFHILDQYLLCLQVYFTSFYLLFFHLYINIFVRSFKEQQSLQRLCSDHQLYSYLYQNLNLIYHKIGFFPTSCNFIPSFS